ncbi:cbb3-type cytochrome c oxidase subunit I [Thermus thermamylovorans]|uniref:Cytochrome C oxidase subunit I n=1 Tax=Thermus thermamylovorans TaxID=2509362 RepID=A0A4Q9B6X2_9DEIN|nr:cbb3-type cytochrome c oxidase subunit I [Thermus thermamylovorans]TBH21885.1 cytochrome C oxidase subunit I [Thermus thermamylovorans]
MAVRGLPQVYASHPEKKLTLYYLTLGFIALLVGSLFGPFQALNYGNVDAYPLLKRLLPFVQSYYQGLTLHGVLNAIVFTQLMAMAIMFYLPARELAPLGVKPNLALGWIAWWMAFGGLLLAAWPLLANEASVLYTFYPPLQGHWAFYLGATVFVAASLVVGLMVLGMWLRFRKLHPGKVTPLATYMAVTFWLMWFLASLGLVVEAVFFLIPWSFGLIQGVDPLLARTLFWWTGHPIVYFWLLPAYALLYLVLPRIAGGKLISDPLARLVFLLFLLFSVPVGFHHQYADPGIDPTWKFVHAVLTLFVAVPSLITAFTIAASLELAGRNRGGKGLFGWIPVLPWHNPAFVAPVLGLIAFIPGGAGGIVNASYSLNYVVHNTAWVPGHFHLQVGTLVTMTMMGAVFWLIPHLTGKPLSEPIRKAGLAGVWLWFVGMMVMAVGLHWQGLLFVPRRSYIAEVPDAYAHTAVPMVFNVLSGIILLAAIAFFFYALFALLLQGRREVAVAESEVPFTEVLSNGQGRMVALMDRVWFWFALAVILVALAYLPTLVQLFTNMNPVPGMRVW